MMLGCRVVLFPQPLVGHMNPMIHLANVLHSKGFSITIIHTRFNSPDPSKFPNFTFHFIEDALWKVKDNPPSEVLKILHDLNASCLAPFRGCLSQIIDASSSKEPVACLILDPFWQFAATVSEEFNLPRIALRTGGILASIVYDVLPLLREKGYFPLQEARQQEIVPEILPLKVKDLPSEEHHNTLVAMVEETKHCTQGIICNTYKELEGPDLDRFHQTFPSIPVFPLGPLHKHPSSNESSVVIQDQSYLTWLNKQAPNSVLYVSFGTLAVIGKEELLELAWGLANSEQPFLWVVRPKLTGSIENDVLLPKDFLRNVAGRSHIVQWVQQQQVLAHPSVGGFWTHCGWNSTIESISEGVPMICFPFFGDQRVNARQISDTWRIGLHLERGLERKEIERTIRTLMVEKEGKDMRERAATLKEKTKDCIGEGGSSYESLNRLTSHILSFSSAESVNLNHIE
uniref:Uncharacterized protein n=1 Tax=Opuntia streptacantha TaxID=393608 RepID=A0A7C9CYR8_OPUST